VKLRRLWIDRLPGIDEAFELADMGEGVHAILGPNGIGKSSCCRAVRALLWSARGPTEGFAVRALLDCDGAELLVEREGRSYRWTREGATSLPPELPAAHLDHCFFLGLRGLLDPASGPDQDLAAVIRRQMAGGFDLDDARQTLYGGIGKFHGKGEWNELDRARRELRRAEGEHAQLGREEDALAGLRAELAAAETAKARLDHVKDALELAGLRAELAENRRELATLPEEVAGLTGDELQTIEAAEQKESRAKEQRRAAEEVIATAREGIRESGLAERLNKSEHSANIIRARTLQGREFDRKKAHTEHAAAEAAVVEAFQPLRAAGVDPPDVDVAKSAELFQHLSEAQDLRTRRSELDHRLRLLEEKTFPEEKQRRLERLGHGIEVLRQLLRTPTSTSALPNAQIWLFAALAIAVLGAAGALTLHSGFVGLVGLGLGVAAVLLLLRARDGEEQPPREAARRALAQLEIREPAEWTAEATVELLRELEGQQSELRAGRERARDRQVERDELQSRLTGLEEKAEEIGSRRRELARKLGLEEIPGDAGLVICAEAVNRLQAARVAEKQAAARVETLEGQCRSSLTELAAFLTRHGEAEPADAAGAEAGLGNLKDSDVMLRDARKALEQGQRSLGELEGELEGLRSEIEGVYEKAGCRIDDRAALVRRLEEELPLYRSLREKRVELELGVAREEGRLESKGESDLAALDAEALEEERSKLKERAEQVDSLRDEVARIEAEASRARQGHGLEDRLADLEAAKLSLEERREEALEEAVGLQLLESARRDFEAHQMPDVLQRARALFADFTHHAWELQVADGVLRALDTTSRRLRDLDQLSDGTRSQLLLAARLAFAEESERGPKLPLFLDEALDHSDPARFDAIARALGRIARDQERQVFYLTSDPMDLRRLEAALREEGCPPPKVIDLAEIRRGQVAVEGPEDLSVEPRPAVPLPAGMTPEDYGTALGVPPLRPPRGSDDQHLFHLLRDDLDLLRELLQVGIGRVGQLLGFLPTELGSQIASQSPVGGELGSRCELLEVFCEAWCQGRGRPVDRDAIERSGAVTERYLEGVVGIARELEGDPRALLEALRAREDERLARFHSAKADELEAWLLEEGHLDEREVLDEEGIRARALASPAAARLPGELVGECLHLWWRLAAPAG